MFTNAKKISTIGASLIMMILGIYIVYKNHKRDGFWYGVLAIVLIGTYISINSNGGTETRIGAPDKGNQIG